MAREAAIQGRPLTAAGSGRVLGADLWSGLTLAVISLIGLSAFLYPLFLTKAPHE